MELLEDTQLLRLPELDRPIAAGRAIRAAVIAPLRQLPADVEGHPPTRETRLQHARGGTYGSVRSQDEIRIPAADHVSVMEDRDALGFQFSFFTTIH